ncbi:FHA domain-containing protein [Leptolyngbya sp. FACHB-36]|uniref:FHA domain-containing protein n=1 Tax=Leptolyngbya sp. FACHB-36 TaxID=2692808 RepID=UPI001680215C|nr:FHA domain-containing protein [Leptolyngbya sp. FACHB-36]MBD2021500.1 FHA domain-containing protein [Leptolyngbya sp. FACHB-36]
MSSSTPPHREDFNSLERLKPKPSESAAASESDGAQATAIDPTVRQLLWIASYYLQAVATGRTAFLTLQRQQQPVGTTEVGTSWIIGRNAACAIVLPYASISRLHAAIGYCPQHGFYVLDLGSKNGTYVNRHRLALLRKQFLQDGDTVTLSTIAILVMLSGWKQAETAASSLAPTAEVD